MIIKKDNDAIDFIKDKFPDANLDFITKSDKINLTILDSYEEIEDELKKVYNTDLVQNILIISGSENYKKMENKVQGSLLVSIFDFDSDINSPLKFLGVI